MVALVTTFIILTWSSGSVAIPQEPALRQIALGSTAYWNEYKKWPDSIDQLFPRHNHRGILFLDDLAIDLVTGPTSANLKYAKPSDRGDQGQLILAGSDLVFGTSDDITLEFDEHGIKRTESTTRR